MKCRCCGSIAEQPFVDLGHQPPSNAYLTADQLKLREVTFPLKVYVCNECWLVQLPAHATSDELFTKTYAYFSSVSSTWVDHARRYVDAMVQRFALNVNSFVIEVASNDGYLLQFVQQYGIRCLGIEPTRSTATAAREKGIETVEEFFGATFARDLVSERGHASLLAGNNVLAHVPDLNDFVEGVSIALAEEGVATFEFPHLMRLVQGLQFDTIYHEHFSYLSFHTVKHLFAKHDLTLFDVEELPTHGGSLRIYVARNTSTKHSVTDSVVKMLELEAGAGMLSPNYYEGFQPRVEQAKDNLLLFLINNKRDGRVVSGYGAAAKGNTLLNYAGIRKDLLPLVADAAPSKQGLYLPGSHIPIVEPGILTQSPPDVLLILPWNIAAEVRSQLHPMLGMRSDFYTAIPTLNTVSNQL